MSFSNLQSQFHCYHSDGSFCTNQFEFHCYTTGGWNNLPLVPLADEMMGTPLESDVHLSEVKVEKPYGSSEEYMDTYFRLLRTECFSGMQTGIKSLLKGKFENSLKFKQNESSSIWC